MNLNVGGHFFTTRHSTLLKDPNSMLASMFSGRFELESDKDGRYFIDRDGSCFCHVLNYLRDPTLLPPSSVAMQVYREAQYYRIESLVNVLESYPSVLPIGKIEEQKSAIGNKYYIWKNKALDIVQRKYTEVLKYSLGQDCVITAVRYLSKRDFANAVSLCRSFSLDFDGDDCFPKHNFFCADDEGRRLGFYIGPEISPVDFVLPEDEIPDSRMFTSVLEKDLRHDGFCVSGRSSYTWKCLRCDVMGFLHQIAIKWPLGHVHDMEGKVVNP